MRKDVPWMNKKNKEVKSIFKSAFDICKACECTLIDVKAVSKEGGMHEIYVVAEGDEDKLCLLLFGLSVQLYTDSKNVSAIHSWKDIVSWAQNANLRKISMLG